MKHLITIVLLAVTSHSWSQSVQTKPALRTVRKEFNNQGEQEDYWAKQLFAEKYKKSVVKRYNDSVVVNSDGTYRYSDKVLIVWNTDDSLKTIFKKGIFYPQLITGNSKSISKTKSQLEAMTASQKIFYYLAETDSVIISNFKECKFLNNNPKQKRFKFWVINKAVANPTVYFIELTNEKATPSTRMTAFIDNAVVTFIKDGWVIM